MGLFDGIGAALGSSVVSSFLGPALGAGAGILSSQEEVKSSRENQERALNALQNTTPIQTTTRDPVTGGFTSEFRPGTAPAIFAAGDPGRALEANRLSQNPERTFSNLQEAIRFGERDINTQRKHFGRVADQFLASQQRRYPDQNTGANAATLTALGEAFEKLQLNANEQGLQRFQDARRSDLEAKQLAFGLTKSLAPILESPASGGQIIAQTPQPTPLGGGEAVLASAQNAINDLQQQQFTAQNNARTDALLRAFLGDQYNPPVA